MPYVLTRQGKTLGRRYLAGGLVFSAIGLGLLAAPPGGMPHAFAIAFALLWTMGGVASALQGWITLKRGGHWSILLDRQQLAYQVPPGSNEQSFSVPLHDIDRLETRTSLKLGAEAMDRHYIVLRNGDEYPIGGGGGLNLAKLEVRLKQAGVPSVLLNTDR